MTEKALFPSKSVNLVKRLRGCHGIESDDPSCHCGAAADEIERLRGELQGILLGADGMGWGPRMPPFEFDRYVNGRLMAQGICIERADTLAQATLKAVRLAEPYDVLVFRVAPETAP